MVNGSALQNMNINIGQSNQIDKNQIRNQQQLNKEEANAPQIAQIRQQHQLKRKNFSPSAGQNTKNLSSFDMEMPMVTHIQQSQSKQGSYSETKNFLTGAQKINAQFPKQAPNYGSNQSRAQSTVQQASGVTNVTSINNSTAIDRAPQVMSQTGMSNESQKNNNPISLNKKNTGQKMQPLRQSQNGSQISMQAVKQIKAEAFKSYISQATQLQQKIIEQSLVSKMEDVGGISGLNSFEGDIMKVDSDAKQIEEFKQSRHNKVLSRTEGRFQQNKNTESTKINSPDQSSPIMHLTSKPPNENDFSSQARNLNIADSKAKSMKEKGSVLPEVIQPSQFPTQASLERRGQPQQYVTANQNYQLQHKRSDVGINAPQILSQSNLMHQNTDFKLPDATAKGQNASLFNQNQQQSNTKRNSVQNPFNDYNPSQNKFNQPILIAPTNQQLFGNDSNSPNKHNLPIKVYSQEHEIQKQQISQSPRPVNAQAQLGSISSQAMVGYTNQRSSINKKLQHLQNAQWSQRSGSLHQYNNADASQYQTNDQVEEKKHHQQQINHQQSWGGNGNNQSMTNLNNQNVFNKKSNSIPSQYPHPQQTEQSQPLPNINKGNNIQMTQIQNGQIQGQAPVIYQQNHYHFNSGTGQPLIVLVSSPKQRMPAQKDEQYDTQLTNYIQDQQKRQSQPQSQTHRQVQLKQNEQKAGQMAAQQKQTNGQKQNQYYTPVLNEETDILNTHASQQSLKLKTPQQQRIFNHPSNLN